MTIHAGCMSWSERARPLTMLLGMFLLGNVLIRSAMAQPNGSPGSGLPYVVDPNRVEGHHKCIDCHRTELAAWHKSKHATTAFDELRTNPNSREYAQQLGIGEADIARNSICVTCHATPTTTDTAPMRVLAGVSCEACHNPSGGDDGWLNPHAVYGPPGTTRKQETKEHFEMRVAKCRNAGQIGSVNPFQLARACFRCHTVSQEALVNKTSHKMGGSKGFEFVAWSLGEVRHNFHLNENENAVVSTLWTSPIHGKDKRERTEAKRIRVMYLAGWLADLEVSLRLRARATEEGNFSDTLNGRIEDAVGELEAIVDEMADVELTSVQEAIDAGAEIMDEYLDTVDPENAQAFTDAAAKVEEAGNQFVKTHDGSQLAGLDEYGLPTPEDGQGDPFQPQ